MRENTQLDSKGGSDSIIPNGFYPNGLVRASIPAPLVDQTGKETENSLVGSERFCHCLEVKPLKMANK